MAYFLVKWAILGASVWVAAELITGITVDGGFWTYLWIAAVFGLVNAILGTVTKLISLPIVILTFGLFLLVINTAMLALTAGLIDSFSIENFWSALLGSIVISLVSVALNMTVGQATRSRLA